MTKISGGQLAARQLRMAGIDSVFGVVAGPMIETLAAAGTEGLQVIGCRHELNACFMASAWGWQKQLPGVMIAGSGPAVTNCLTPLYVATESAMPLVVLGGSSTSSDNGLGNFQELDQVAAAKPVCKWVGRVDSTRRIGEWIHLALGKALQGRPGGVYLDFPGELVSQVIDEEQALLRHAPEITRAYPDPQAIERLVALLQNAERPLLIIGKGAAWADAGPALQKIADLGIPYITSPMARGTIPDDHPNFCNAARSMALRNADLVVMIGGRFNWMFQFGRSFDQHATLVQIDVEPEEMHSGANVSLGIVADARLAAEQLGEALQDVSLTSADGRWLNSLRAKCRANEQDAEAALRDDAMPINPYRAMGEIRAALPRDAIVTAEGETVMGVSRAIIPSYLNRAGMNSGTTGCMGVGAPYVLGASLACPDRLSVGILGDYAFGSAAMVVETAARIGAAPVFIVLNNQGIAGHLIQDRMFPAAAGPVATLLPARYDKLAEMVGGHGEHVERPEDIRPALERAFASGKVAVVHILIDPKGKRLSGINYIGE